MMFISPNSSSSQSLAIGLVYSGVYSDCHMFMDTLHTPHSHMYVLCVYRSELRQLLIDKRCCTREVVNVSTLGYTIFDK